LPVIHISVAKVISIYLKKSMFTDKTLEIKKVFCGKNFGAYYSQNLTACNKKEGEEL